LSESDEVEDDSELDDYYKELGIDPSEMKGQDYKTERKQKKQE
jgi:hypothetical protein